MTHLTYSGFFFLSTERIASKLRSPHLSADRPLQRLRGCFLGDNAAVPRRPPTGSKFRNVQVLLTFLMCVNLQHFVTERDIHVTHAYAHTDNAPLYRP